MPHSNTLRHLIAMVLFFLVCPITGAYAQNDTVMLFPISIHSETSMDFLQKGMGDLLEAKLTAKGMNVIRSDNDVDKATALSMATDHKAQTVVMGSLTFLGSSASLNLFHIDAETGKNHVAFSKVEPTKDKLFDDLTEFTDQITKIEPVPETPKVVTPPLSAEIKPAKPILSGNTIRSADIKAELNALAIGDLKGTGQKHVVCSESDAIHILPFKNGAFEDPVSIKGKAYLTNLFVDAMDTNGNGIDEIIVTATHIKSNQASSYAYEWNGTDYAVITEDMPWFLRKARRPDTGQTVLLGQEQHYAKRYFGPTISVMAWSPEKRSYLPTETCTSPSEKLNIYAFDMGTLMNDGTPYAIMYSQADYLIVAGKNGEEKWTSSTRYGGSNKFILPREQVDQSRFYISPRIMAGDFDEDGICDIVTVNNKNATPRVFSNLRRFVEGRVICLNWNTLNFQKSWSTQTVSGYIADFYVDDLTSDGHFDLIYCVVPKKKKFLGSRTSFIVVQPITAR